MKNKYRLLKVFVTIVILVFLLSFSLKRFNEKPVDDIDVKLLQGDQPVYFMDEGRIKKTLMKDLPENKMRNVNIPQMEKKISSSPYVDSANVYMTLAGNIHVDIRQRIPAFRLERGDKVLYVDREGTEFPLSKYFAPVTMLVTGPVAPSEYKDLIHLISLIQEDSFLNKMIIGIRKTNRDYSLLTQTGDFDIEIGNLEKPDLKLQGLKEFINKYLVYQQPDKYKKISVKFDNQIVTTLKGKYRDSIMRGVKPAELPKAPSAAVAVPQKNNTPEKKTEKKPEAKAAKKPEKKSPQSEAKKTSEKPKKNTNQKKNNK